MDNKPSNESTVVQIIGRARRNALFWRNDIDILAKGNERLLEQTRKCYIFYNVPETAIEQNSTGELSYSLCDVISVERLKPDTEIYVNKGQMRNGLKVLELEGKTGKYHISIDQDLNFNVVDNNDFYKTISVSTEKGVLSMKKYETSVQRIGLKSNAIEYFRTCKPVTTKKYDINKYFYYLFKMRLKKTNPLIASELEKRHFELFTRISDPYHLCDKKKIRSTFMELGIYYDFAWSKHSIDSNHSYEEKLEAYEKSKILPPPYEDKKWIFESYYSIGRTLGREFLKYVDWIEYFDMSSYEKVETFLELQTNIVQLSVNKYKILSHPPISYLNDEGIYNLNDLKQKISQTKGRYIMKASTSLWKKMLSEISKFDEIDDYDSVIVDLEYLNAMYRLGLSKKQLNMIVNTDYPLVKRRIEDYPSNIFIYEINKKNGVPKKAKNKQIYIYKDDIISSQKEYTKIVNDREIGIVGPDNMKYSGGRYIEDKPVTSKIDNYCKFSRFIENRYKKELDECYGKLFSGENNFGFDKLCNSCLGFCVEYYAKMIVYGDDIFKTFLSDAMREAKSKEINDIIRVRAAILAYRYEMMSCFGEKTFSVIPSIKIEKLIQDSYSTFVNTVITLGKKAADFIKRTLYGNEEKPKYDIDPNLSVNHISALCDFITNDTILDLKCTSSISISHIKQVLSYHYLSTKRSDVNIKRLIVYDAVSGRSAEINIS